MPAPSVDPMVRKHVERIRTEIANIREAQDGLKNSRARLEDDKRLVDKKIGDQEREYKAELAQLERDSKDQLEHAQRDLKKEFEKEVKGLEDERREVDRDLGDNQKQISRTDQQVRELERKLEELME